MTRALAARSLALLPVVEVEPYVFSQLPMPSDLPSRDYRDAWSAYFQRCMADAGFAGVSTIDPGSNLVAAGTLVDNPLLERLIAHAVDGAGVTNFPLADNLSDYAFDQRISSLPGGLAFVADGAIAIKPTCCCCLADLRELESAVRERRSGRILGHAVLTITFTGDQVTFTEGWEYPPAPAHLIELTVAVDAFAAALAAARVELTAFRHAIEPMVTRMLAGDPAVASVCELVAGLA